jgi:diketogulonate reductase-like aldo/keto reductase
MHWPGVSKTAPTSQKNKILRTDTWRAMCDLYRQGKCRSIGVSNFTCAHLEHIKQVFENDSNGEFIDTLMPMVNQVELHPALPQHDVRRYGFRDSAKIVQAMGFSSFQSPNANQTMFSKIES